MKKKIWCKGALVISNMETGDRFTTSNLKLRGYSHFKGIKMAKLEYD